MLITVFIKALGASGGPYCVNLQSDGSVRMLREAVALKFKMRPRWVILYLIHSHGMRYLNLQDSSLLADVQIHDGTSVYFNCSVAYFRKCSDYEFEVKSRRWDKLEKHVRLVGRAAMMFNELYAHVSYRPFGRGMREAQASFDRVRSEASLHAP